MPKSARLSSWILYSASDPTISSSLVDLKDHLQKKAMCHVPHVFLAFFRTEIDPIADSFKLL